MVDAEVPFHCGKQTLESWNFKINGPEKILEIHMKNGDDQGKKFLKMEDTVGGHYEIVLETRINETKDSSKAEEDLGILFMEDKENSLCSFRAVKKVHEVNRHKGKEQLLQAYRNSGWMSPEMANIIERVVNDCKVCQKFQRSVARPHVTLPKASSFNEVVTLDLKEFGNKYVLWMRDSFLRFMVGKLISNKKSRYHYASSNGFLLHECRISLPWILC